jgi:hypothetical protein
MFTKQRCQYKPSYVMGQFELADDRGVSTGLPYLVRGRTTMSSNLNFAINLSAIWPDRDNLFALTGFSHLQHLLLRQVASSCQRSCLKFGALWLPIGLANTPLPQINYTTQRLKALPSVDNPPYGKGNICCGG